MVIHNIVRTVAPPATAAAPTTQSRSAVRTRPRRSPNKFGLSAAQFIVSVGGDADLVADWTFYAKSVEKAFLPQWVLNLQLAFCIIATVLWSIQVTDGRIVKPILNCCNLTLSNKYVLALGILLEDVPQIVLSFLVDDVYGTGLTPAAMANIMSSAYDIFIKVVAVITGEADDDAEEVDGEGGEEEGLVEGSKDETYGSTA